MKALLILLLLPLLLLHIQRQASQSSSAKKNATAKKETISHNKMQNVIPDSTYRIAISICSDSSGNNYWLSDEYSKGVRLYHLTKYAPGGLLLWQKEISEGGYTLNTIKSSKFTVDAAGNVSICSLTGDTYSQYYHTYRFDNSGASFYSDTAKLYADRH
jgi:hypothetical protein